MAAVGVLVLGAGVYLMYYAIRSGTTHPIAHVLTALPKAAKAGTGG